MADGILTKNITLYYSTTAATTPDNTPKGNWNWSGKTAVSSMFSFPAPRGTRDAISVTNLSCDSQISIPGLRNNGDRLTFEVYYEGNDSGDNWTKLNTLANGNVAGFALEFPATHTTNKVIYFFEGIADVTMQGGGVNEAIKCTLDIFLQSDIDMQTSFT